MLVSFFLASIFLYPLRSPPPRARATGLGRDVGISGVASVTLSILSGREHQQPTSSVLNLLQAETEVLMRTAAGMLRE